MRKIFQLYLDNAKREKPAVKMALNGDEATIYIYDIIDPDWGVSAMAVIADIAQAAGATTLHVRINSPGGDVFESRAIIEAIKRFPGNTIAHIDSLAASAATSIAIACNEVEMSDGGFFMIHNANGMAWGDKSAMRSTADLLEKVEGVIAAEYAADSGQDVAQVVDWMEAETWFTAQEAIDAGFVDRLSTSAAVKNIWNMAAFAKAPQALLASPPPAPAEPPKDPAPAAAPSPSMSRSNANRLALLQAL